MKLKDDSKWCTEVHNGLVTLRGLGKKRKADTQISGRKRCAKRVLYNDQDHSGSGEQYLVPTHSIANESVKTRSEFQLTDLAFDKCVSYLKMICCSWPFKPSTAGILSYYDQDSGELVADSPSLALRSLRRPWRSLGMITWCCRRKVVVAGRFSQRICYWQPPHAPSIRCSAI